MKCLDVNFNSVFCVVLTFFNKGFVIKCVIFAIISFEWRKMVNQFLGMVILTLDEVIKSLKEAILTLDEVSKAFKVGYQI